MTASISGNGKTATVTRRTSPMAALADRWIPKLVLAPSVVISLIFVYGFIAITGFLSLSDSRLMPRYNFVGLDRYRELFDNDVFWTSAANLGWFGIPFIGICIGLGLFLAILLDQQIRNEGALRAVFLYPMALSFIVTGTAWQWIMTPSVGPRKGVPRLGLDELLVQLAGRSGQGDLLRRDRGRLAIHRLRDGAVSRGLARCRR
ncbi:ABC-type sugar transport system permease subunit [Paraburkholderia bryophila]|uniref:ABC-type sugar transport system permease subunit n=1 Tax=Paraburkholderia bryophila TaxID=420952 RepID=A0A7Y9WD74_9BURK|nr:ABC-type sugar transport system permease subunit [Paraburkholderia bryophila]